MTDLVTDIRMCGSSGETSGAYHSRAILPSCEHHERVGAVLIGTHELEQRRHGRRGQLAGDAVAHAGAWDQLAHMAKAPVVLVGIEPVCEGRPGEGSGVSHDRQPMPSRAAADAYFRLRIVRVNVPAAFCVLVMPSVSQQVGFRTTTPPTV